MHHLINLLHKDSWWNLPEIFKIKNLHEIDNEAEVGLYDFEEIIDENRGFGDCNDQMVGSYWNKG